MKKIEEMPTIGYLTVTIYFGVYKDSIQNDTRRRLNGSYKSGGLPQYIGENVDFQPETFSLLKEVVGKKSRSYGARHSYMYMVNSTDELKQIIEKIKEWYEKEQKNKSLGWDGLKLEYCEDVGGY